jgi:GT2 family glycosyltransferase
MRVMSRKLTMPGKSPSPATDGVSPFDGIAQKTFRPRVDVETRIAAVIVAFRDRPAVLRCLRALRAQTRPIDTIIVVDNSEHSILTLDDEDAGSLVLLHPGRNIGIAGALNLGLEKARSMGHDWCWTFDQDSEPFPNALEELVFALECLPLGDQASIGIIASTGVSRATGSLHRGNPARWLPRGGTQGNQRRSVYECDVVLTAGSLTNVAAFSRLGGANADYFIDWVDFELCVRFRQAGYRVLSCQTSFYLHQIGGKEGYAAQPTDRRRLSQLRSYTAARNAVHTVLRQSWGLRRFPYLLALIAMFLWESRESGNPRAAWAGIVDGFAGRYFGVEQTLRRVNSLREDSVIS